MVRRRGVIKVAGNIFCEHPAGGGGGGGGCVCERPLQPL